MNQEATGMPIVDSDTTDAAVPPRQQYRDSVLSPLIIELRNLIEIELRKLIDDGASSDWVSARVQTVISEIVADIQRIKKEKQRQDAAKYEKSMAEVRKRQAAQRLAGCALRASPASKPENCS
jgi:hypothetical protein